MNDDRPSDALVWYAAYGSNLSLERFMTYIGGGTPPGSSKAHDGCTDRRPPRESRPYRIRGHHLYFTGDSPSWGGGGVAFITPRHREGEVTLARLYLVTAAQLREILAQENGIDPASIEHLVPDDFLAADEGPDRLELPEGSYRLLLRLGQEASDRLSGRRDPVWTFTSPEDLSDSPRFPSRSYLRTICRGLAESHWGIEDARLHWSTTDQRTSQEELCDYLVDALPQEGQTKSVKDELEAACEELTDRCFRTGKFEVDRTFDRDRTGRTFVVQLSRCDRKQLGIERPWPLSYLPTRVVLEKKHPRKRVILHARVHRPRSSEEKLREGVVHMDQKLRQALGVRASDPALDQPGDRVAVRKPTKDDRPRDRRKSWFGRALHALLRRFGGVQHQLMRVTIARYEEMEIGVCRIPETGFEILGIEPGDFVILESPTARTSLRALKASDEMVRVRVESSRGSKKMTDCGDELSLKRLAPHRDEDLPLIFLDLDARKALAVTPCDPVYVYRNVPRLLSKQLRLLGLTLVVSASIVVFDLDLAKWVGEEYEGLVQTGLFGLALVLGFLLALLELRTRIT